MPKRSTVLAIDLGGTKVCVAVVDQKGLILDRCTELVDKSFRLAPVKQMVRLARTVMDGLGKGQRPLSVGVVVPGLVRRDGTVWAPNVDGWERIPLGRLLQDSFGLPVVVDSDRTGAVLGEVFSPKGAARGKSDVVSLIVGTGIGAGIFADGKLLRGAHVLSGCAGWMALSLNSRMDSGDLECLEAFASGPGVVRLARSAIKAGVGGRMGKVSDCELTAHLIAQLAREGDFAAQDVWNRMGQSLGLAVANVVSLFDPEVVVIGGGLVGAADCFWDLMKRTALQRAQPLAAKQVKIVLSRLGNDSNLLGASYLARELYRSKAGQNSESNAQLTDMSLSLY